mgnify:CR=1 FL=1
MKELEIKLYGERYLLIGDRHEGAITTEHAFRHGFASFAHLMPDGRIMQRGQQIGTRTDIEEVGEIEVVPDDDAFSNVLVHPSWGR